MQVFLAWITLSLAGQVAQGDRYSDTTPPAAAAPVAGESAEPAAEGVRPTTPATAGDEFFNDNGSAATAAEPPADTGAALPPASGSAPAAPPATIPNQVPLAAGAPDQALPEASVLVQGAKPSELMRSLLRPPASGQLAGVPVTLSDVVRESRSRQDQTARAKAYWNLSAATANYYLALLEHTELSVLRQGIANPSGQWDQRLAEAASRIESTRRAALAAQLRLQQHVGRVGAGALPLPADVPHCGRYNAEYEEIFASRPDLVAKQLSELLPLRYAALRAEAQAVADAIGWREHVSVQRDPHSDGAELLNAQELLCLKRRSFIATARDYNEEIAAYTELAAPNEVAPDRLVAMMIRTSARGAQPPRNDSQVRQAAAVDDPPAADSAAETGGWPKTFAEEQRTEVRRPLRRMFEREHSIVSAIKRLRDRQE